MTFAHSAPRLLLLGLGCLLAMRSLPAQDAAPLSLNYDFSSGDVQGWTAGRAGFPGNPKGAAYYNFRAGLQPIPEELGEGYGFRVKAFHPQGTSSVFLKQHLHGLQPESLYWANCRLRFITNEPFLHPSGTGDEGLREVTVGVFTQEPTATRRVADFGYKRAFDIHLFPDLYAENDHGQVGRTIGLLAVGPNPAPFDLPVPYQFKELATTKPVLFRTDAKGRAWALVNVGYREVLGRQSPDAFYVQQITLDLTPLPTLEAPTVTAQAEAKREGLGEPFLACNLSITNQTDHDFVIPITPESLFEAVVSDEGGTPVYVTSQRAAFVDDHVTIAPGERYHFLSESRGDTYVFDSDKAYTVTLRVTGTDLTATTTFRPNASVR